LVFVEYKPLIYCASVITWTPTGLFPEGGRIQFTRGKPENLLITSSLSCLTLFLLITSKTALWPIKPPIQWVLGALSPG
jgi:hypothetical protein